MTTLPLPLQPQTDVESYAHALRDSGFAYFPAVLDSGQITALRQAMDALTVDPDSYDQYTSSEEGAFLNKSINNAFNKDPLFAQYLALFFLDYLI